VEDRAPGDNPPRGAIINYYLETKAKEDLVLEVLDEAGKLVRRFSSKKQEPEIAETDPDAPGHVYKPTVLSNEPGMQRVTWDLTATGPKLIPGAKNDAGLPHHGPLVLPGTYSLRLNVDGKVLTSSVEVRLDPRVKTTGDELRERYRLGMEIFTEIGRLADTVLELRSAREQLKERIEAAKKWPKTEDWAKQARSLVERLDVLEEKLHNPRAAVTYDILAQKGGAKLYSQLVPLYQTVLEADGPLTVGILQTFTDRVKDLRALELEWLELRRGEVARMNQRARELQVPAVILPETAR
jgi:hypothetical protein